MNNRKDYEIRAVAIAELRTSPTIGGLTADYKAECGESVALEGRLEISWETYESLEAVGGCRAFGAFLRGALVGFSVVVVSQSLRRAGMEAAAESLFLAPEHRRGGPGLRLLQAARDAALEAGAPGLIVTAPVGSQLERLASAAGYDIVSKNYLVR